MNRTDPKIIDKAHALAMACARGGETFDGSAENAINLLRTVALSRQGAEGREDVTDLYADMDWRPAFWKQVERVAAESAQKINKTPARHIADACYEFADAVLSAREEP